MRGRDTLPRWAAVLVFLLVAVATIGAEVAYGLPPLVRTLVLIYAFLWCFDPFSGRRRARVERLGGRDEARRFSRAWTSGEVPPDVDRDLWLAETQHLPTDTRFGSVKHAATVVAVGLAGITIALFAVASVVGGDLGDQLRLVASLVAPFAILNGIFVLVLRFTMSPAERTARLRHALESHAT